MEPQIRSARLQIPYFLHFSNYKKLTETIEELDALLKQEGKVLDSSAIKSKTSQIPIIFELINRGQAEPLEALVRADLKFWKSKNHQGLNPLEYAKTLNKHAHDPIIEILQSHIPSNLRTPESSSDIRQISSTVLSLEDINARISTTSVFDPSLGDLLEAQRALSAPTKEAEETEGQLKVEFLLANKVHNSNSSPQSR